VLDKLSPRLQAFVQELSGKTPPQLAQFLTDSQIVTAGPTPQAHLLGVVEGSGVAWPPGVLASNGGPVQKLLVPPDKILAVAALPQVTHLTTNPPTAPSLDLARTMVHYPLLDAKIPVAQRGGAGVLVGIIDTGVDGGHPGFAGRLIAVWDQGNPPAVAGTSPAGRHVGNAAYTLFNWGTELQGPAETVNSQDPNGHGTHVTGIAAGAEVRNAAGVVVSPAGLAPAAKIVVVRCIGVTGGDPVTAVQWIFQKAQELSTPAQPLVPCVINMSFGTNDHPHDGSGLLSLQMFQQVWQTASKTYRPGRILIGAAGNERNASMHVLRQTAAGATVSIPIRTGVRPPPPPAISSQETVTFWIKNPGTAHPAAFALDLQVFRQSNPLATTPLVRVGNATAGWINFPGLNTRIAIASSLWNPTNGDMQFTVRFSSIGAINLPADTWMLRFVNGSALPLDIHGWIVAGWRGNSAFGGLLASDEAYQVGSPADSPGVVSVASVNSRLVWRRFGGVADEPPFAWAGTVGDISSFSSAGPLRAAAVAMQTMYQNFEDVRAVDVTAPGCRLQSALSRQATAPAGDIITRDPATAAGIARTFLDQGTSMASPLVAGLVANILALEPQLTTLDVLERLKRASSIPAASTFQPPPSSEGGLKPYSKDWGYGLVDANLLK
jgi:subtilisin family serine protease